MHAARTQLAHVIDYSADGLKVDGAKACQREIVRFVRGVRGSRKTQVTAAQIVKWFRATPEDFVQAQIDEALLEGRIRISPRSLGSTRRASGTYVYTADQ